MPAQLRIPVVAEVTRNPAPAGDPARLFIDAATPDGRATGVVRDCVISCLVLVTEYADTLVRTFGRLSPAMRAELDACLASHSGQRTIRILTSESSQSGAEASFSNS